MSLKRPKRPEPAAIDRIGRQRSLLPTLTPYCWCALIVALLLANKESLSAEWSVTTTIDQEFLFDDNPRLRTENYDPIFGSTTSPESRYRYRSPTLDISLYGRFDFARFNDKAFNSEDLNIRLDSEYTQERSIWGIDGLFARDSTRYTETADTGNFEDIATRLLFKLQPSYGYQLSEIDVPARGFRLYRC